MDLGCKVACDVGTIKEYQLKNCSIFEPPPFRLAKIVRDEWTDWHKLWQNLKATRTESNVSYCSTFNGSPYTTKSRRDRSMIIKLPKVSTNSMDR